MMNLFEIMQSAQGGNAINNLANQFGLSPQQTQSAVEALLPAVSMGLRNQAQSPDMLSQLAAMMMNGQSHQQAFEDANNDGIPDHLQQGGNEVLGQLFGSKQVSRAVADQASVMSGVSSTILKSMLPVIASMVMGGLFKSASNQGLGGLLGQLAGGMMPGMGGAQGNNPMGGGMGGGIGAGMGGAGMGGAGMGGAGGLGGLLGGLLGGGQQTANAGAGGLGGLLGAMLGGGQPNATAGAGRGQPQQMDPMQAGLEQLTNMFGAGRQVQEQHQNNLQSIFDAFLKR